MYQWALALLITTATSVSAMELSGLEAKALFDLTKTTFQQPCSSDVCTFHLADIECLGTLYGTSCSAKTIKSESQSMPMVFAEGSAANRFAHFLELFPEFPVCGSAGTFHICLIQNLSCERSSTIYNCKMEGSNLSE